jgi:hypothetical protein
LLTFEDRILQQYAGLVTVPPQWLIPRNTNKEEPASLTNRLAQLNTLPLQDPKKKSYITRTRARQQKKIIEKKRRVSL